MLTLDEHCQLQMRIAWKLGMARCRSSVHSRSRRVAQSATAARCPQNRNNHGLSTLCREMISLTAGRPPSCETAFVAEAVGGHSALLSPGIGMRECNF